jgi:hypothetical protein
MVYNADAASNISMPGFLLVALIVKRLFHAGVSEPINDVSQAICKAVL